MNINMTRIFVFTVFYSTYNITYFGFKQKHKCVISVMRYFANLRREGNGFCLFFHRFFLCLFHSFNDKIMNFSPFLRHIYAADEIVFSHSFGNFHLHKRMMLWLDWAEPGLTPRLVFHFEFHSAFTFASHQFK